ncbi:MAG TPA: hypothetical protein VII92_00700 [Anaerolineae bacterium]
MEFNRSTDLTISIGGGAYFTASQPYIDHAYFISHRAEQSGGIYSENGPLSLSHSVISDNVAQNDGGGGVDIRGTNSFGSIYSAVAFICMARLLHSTTSRSRTT